VTDDPARRSLVLRLSAAPARFTAAAATWPTAEPRPGEWTAQQVVLHLVAVELEVFQQRLREIHQAAGPTWTWVEPGPASREPDETIAQSLDRFAAARARTLEEVGSLDEAGWLRFGEHATLGRLDVAGLLALASDHDAEHLAALTQD
jgi:DinB superfamily